MQNNNNVISEQQELEQSKSKDEEIVTEYEHTAGQSFSRIGQVNHVESTS